MSKDLENIQIIAQKLKRILKPWDGDMDSFLTEEARKCYLLDERENIIGLNLFNCNINDISFLELLPNLTQIDLRNNEISDFSFLQALPNLTQLDVSYNQISDFSFLRSLLNLTQLDVSRNRISDCFFLQSLLNLTQLSLSHNQISDCSFLQSLPNLTQLDVSRNQISDCSFLQSLPNLTQLDVSDNQISDCSFLQSLPNLTQLDVSDNKISDCSFLRSLPNLTRLDVSENQISDCSFLRSLPNLTQLDVSENQISDFSFLQSLPNLTQLSLRNNKISDFSFLRSLPNLTQLSLRNDKISDFSFLRSLPNLTQLSLRNNQISDFSFLQSLPNLTQLDVGGNQISDCSFLRSLPNLTQLDVSYNKISDCSFLQSLPNLTQLDVSYNKISDCSFCKHLKYIRRVNLRANQIRELPASLLDLHTEMEWGKVYSYLPNAITLYGNPIETPPLEIVQQGHFAIEAWFRSLKAGKKPLNEVKVQLVGDGGSGKTSLVKQLFGEAFDKSEAQTHGIRIRHWGIGTQKRKINVRFWDFGGQEIMHATHQFFLSKRSLYILVLDGRKEEDAEYWLKHMESFGGDSPILIVLNKTDQNPGFDVNRKFLQEKYKGIKGFHKISCATRFGIDEFSARLKEELAQVELIQTVWPETWFNVKTELETMPFPYISHEKYRDICNGENIVAENQDILVEFLNDLGVIVHFKDFNLLDTHIIEPKWVTEAVYKIINSNQLAESRGILKFCDMDGILQPKTKEEYCYPREKYQYIVDVMLKFQLCYEIDKDSVLIPDLLDVQEPAFAFDEVNALKFLFEYDFLPKSVMPRFIVKQHKDIKNHLRWRTGLVLEDKNLHVTALVKADVRDRKIFISVNGEQKRDYFSVIRKTFRDIHSSFEKLDVKEWIPLPDNPEITVEYDELVGYEQMFEDEYKVGKLRKSYSVSKLLNGIEKQEDRRGADKRIIHVHGNYQEEVTMGNDTISITAQGDVAFGKDQAIVTINKAIQQSGASDDLKANLEKLTKAVEAMIKQMPKDDADEAKENLEILVKQATSEKPKRKWYSISGEGLIDAAKAIGSLGKPVIETTQAVLKLLGA
ncbi:MAG: leucine-rich repeat domain-containing protein [Desulfococcaceae bacterium]